MLQLDRPFPEQSTFSYRALLQSKTALSDIVNWLCCLPQVGLGVAAAATAVAVAMGPPALPVQAVTNEQLLFLEAWRAVDRAYVDKSFNGQSWFKVCQSSAVIGHSNHRPGCV
jgi:hypothetical protein